MSASAQGRLPDPVLLAVTGASGAPYALRLLHQLVEHRVRTWLIVSPYGFRLLHTESGIADLAALRAHVGSAGFDQYVTVFADDDRGAPPASGSARCRAMVICPCSMGTVSAIANGTSRSLIERAADVTLKERRRLIVVPRETPLSLIHLENLTRITSAGAVVMPAAPGFYHRPTAIADLVDFIVARILDHLEIEHTIGSRWSGERVPDA